MSPVQTCYYSTTVEALQGRHRMSYGSIGVEGEGLETEVLPLFCSFWLLVSCLVCVLVSVQCPDDVRVASSLHALSMRCTQYFSTEYRAGTFVPAFLWCEQLCLHVLRLQSLAHLLSRLLYSLKRGRVLWLVKHDFDVLFVQMSKHPSTRVRCHMERKPQYRIPRGAGLRRWVWCTS